MSGPDETTPTEDPDPTEELRLGTPGPEAPEGPEAEQGEVPLPDEVGDDTPVGGDRHFADTDLPDTDFEDTDFEDTDFEDTDFEDTDLAGSAIEDTDVEESTLDDGVDEESTVGEPAAAPALPAVPGTAEGQGLRKATALMAVGTTLSRATGLLRLFALGYAVGAFRLADSYNLANTMPNIVQDIVLGGILSATFVPVFVHRLTTRADDEAWEAVSAVVSVTLIVIGAASVVFLVAVPFIVDATTALNHSADAAQTRQLAKDLLFLFVPQLTCYGFISVGTALLNARRRFGAPMFTPIANNVVLVAVLLVFGTVVRHATLAGVAAHRGQILLLGLGTTAGVVIQAGLMIPSLRRAGLRLRWLPDFRHESVRTIIRLSGWTFGLVMTNQAALVVVLALSQKVGAGALSAYTYAYMFFQLPYGIVAVSIMSATAPELTARWARGDLEAFRRRMGTGLRTMLAVIIPAAAGELILARPLVALVVGHGAAAGDTTLTAQALAMLAIGLPGFCIFLYAIRVLQSVQDLRSAFWLYALENGINIVLAVALAGHFGVRGIAFSISAAYSLAAVAALGYVRTRVQGLGGEILGRPLGHVLLATCALVVAAVLGSNVSGSETTVVLLGRVALGAGAGGGAYVLAAGGLAEVARRRRRGRGSRVDGSRGPGSRGPGGSGPGGSGTRGSGNGAARAGSENHVPARTGRRRPGAPPRPEPLPPAGRPPLRPTRLGPTRASEPGPPHHDDPGV